MDIRPIRTQGDYEAALREIESLMAAQPDSPEGDRLDVLATLVEAYEREHYPMDLPNPVAAIKYRMESLGLTPQDLEPMIGRTNRVYEVLSGRRALTVRMIRNLNKGLGIPTDSLIGRSDRDESRLIFPIHR